MTDKEFQELVVKQLQILTEGQQTLNDKVNKLDASVDKLDAKVDKLDAKVDKLDANQVRMENELTEKIRRLYDFREVQNDVNERIISTLERLEAKIDVLQLETAHLRRVK